MCYGMFSTMWVMVGLVHVQVVFSSRLLTTVTLLKGVKMKRSEISVRLLSHDLLACTDPRLCTLPPCFSYVMSLVLLNT